MEAGVGPTEAKPWCVTCILLWLLIGGLIAVFFHFPIPALWALGVAGLIALIGFILSVKSMGTSLMAGLLIKHAIFFPIGFALFTFIYGMGG